MGGKPRIKGHGVSKVIIDEPKKLDPLRAMVDRLGFVGKTDKEIFMELGHRGYECAPWPGRDKMSMTFQGDEITPVMKFLLLVPDGKYPSEEE